MFMHFSYKFNDVTFVNAQANDLECHLNTTVYHS